MSSKNDSKDGNGFSAGAYEEFAKEYHSNPELRHELQVNRNEVLANWGFPARAGFDVRIAVNTQKTFHLVIPEDPNDELSDEALQAV